MPHMLATALVPLISNALIAIGLPSLAFGATVGAIALGASYLLLAGAAYLVSSALSPKTETPKPEDGKYNLKQSVPPLVFILGKVKKGGDYVFLEEKGGRAYHIVVQAAHHIRGYVEHWLHDEKVTLNSSGYVIQPGRFDSNNDGIASVRILTRRGENAETAYSQVVSAFPSIWTNNHRGDGLASVMMSVSSVAQDRQQKVYPNHMPQHTAVIEGHDRIFDPRTATYGYTENLALFRLWHLTHPVGGKLKLTDMHLPDWSAAADICDQPVTNRSGQQEPQYHGGLWFRANSDPIQVGRIMDQAADLVVYERPDGKIGVHFGAFVQPDIRLTANDIISVNWDANMRRGSSVLAVRGRFNDPSKGFNTVDAAIYGIPYPTEDERTKTVDNQAVQRHNHCARLQKLAYIRANAPRVKIVAHYEPAEEVPYRRFVRVHYPSRLTEAVLEIIGQPTISLRDLTVEFEGIVIPSSLYAFNAATEEGRPGNSVSAVGREDVPVPAGFDVVIRTEAIGSGTTATYGEAGFTFQNETFQYELEWQKTSGGETQKAMGLAGEIMVRSLYLVDGEEYRFRARTWSADTPSDWTDYKLGVNLQEKAADWVSALTVQPSVAATVAYNNFYVALAMAGVLAKAEAGQILMAHHEQATRVDLFNPARIGSAVGTIDHVPYQGRKGDAVSGHIETGFNPGDGGSHLFTRDSNCMVLYVEENISGGTDLGAITNSINSHAASGFLTTRNSAATTDTSAISGGASGFIATSRNNGANYRLDVNGVRSTVTRTSSSITNREWWACGYNSTSPQYSPARQSIWLAFSYLTDDELDAVRVATLALRTALHAI